MFPLYAIFILLPAMTLAADGVTSEPGCNKTVDLKADGVALDFYNSINKDDDSNITREEIDAYFESFDNNTDGQVEKEELVAFVDEHYPEFKCHEEEVFNNFDFNKDGILDETDFELIIGLADKDGDTDITKDEFINLFTLLIAALEDLIDLDSLVKPTNGTR